MMAFSGYHTCWQKKSKLLNRNMGIHEKDSELFQEKWKLCEEKKNCLKKKNNCMKKEKN